MRAVIYEGSDEVVVLPFNAANEEEGFETYFGPDNRDPEDYDREEVELPLVVSVSFKTSPERIIR